MTNKRMAERGEKKRSRLLHRSFLYLNTYFGDGVLGFLCCGGLLLPLLPFLLLGPGVVAQTLVPDGTRIKYKNPGL